MSRWIGCAMLACGLVACEGSLEEPSTQPQHGAGRAGERPALEDAIWDDGKAEIATYHVREPRYGIQREGAATLITVKEDLDANTLVKADGPRHPVTITAMKLNTVLTVPAGVYTYRQMASSWLLRETAQPLRLVVSSQEWCGITHKSLTIEDGASLMRGSSYFGAEGERSYIVEVGDDTVLFDTLPVYLRTLDLARPHRIEVALVESEISNRLTPPVITDATIEVGSPATISLWSGVIDVVPVEVRRGDRTDTFLLKSDPPHTLVRWDRSDGGTWTLSWVERAAYWDMNGIEHEGALPSQPLPPDPDQGT